MIRYQISCSNPTSQFLEIELSFVCDAKEPVFLQLPAWRAGRYQLANFAQNIRGFKVKDAEGRKLPFKKVSKDRWDLFPDQSGELIVSYEYWAGKMDAGSAWVDDQQVYVNFVNCCFEILGKSEEETEVTIQLPNFSQQVSTLIPSGKSQWKARDYQILADSTFLAAKELTHWTYQVEAIQFHIWIHGEVHFDRQLLIDHFKAFCGKLIQDFGEFPEPEYHFIFQLLPYSHYHGVEHRRGTVITFGPADSLKDPGQMEELLGISCHELYHAWNVCRIRPKELLPYDFSKETYTKAGLMLEGITTYMGDLYLLKSGVYDLPTYLKHLQKVLSREAAHQGWKNYNIIESSYDLWLDGYVPGIPDRKVNIYTRGALLALGIDVLLIKEGSSLSNLMKRAWEKFGKPFIGYTWQDFESLIMESFSNSEEINRFFSDFIYGHRDLFPRLKELLSEIGLTLHESFSQDRLLHSWGIRVDAQGFITQIHPEAVAYRILMRQDKILSKSESQNGTIFELTLDRLGRVIEVKIPSTDQLFFPELKLEAIGNSELFERWRN